MNFEKNDKVKARTKIGNLDGTIQDRFIQNTELELEGKTLTAEATSETPVYLVNFDNGKSELVSEDALTMVESHTA